MAKRKKQTKRRDLAPVRGGSSTRLSGDRMLDDLKGVAFMAGGFVAGKFIANLVDKGTATVSGIMGIDGTELRPYLRPLVTAGLGLAANQLIKNPMAKKVALGVAAYGVVEGIQKISGNKMLAGLGDAEAIAPPAYTALPEFQVPTYAMPVMGADDAPSDITAGADDEPVNITQGTDDYRGNVEGYDDSPVEGADDYLTEGLEDEDFDISA
jgi:hypothetical protein